MTNQTIINIDNWNENDCKLILDGSQIKTLNKYPLYIWLPISKHYGTYYNDGIKCLELFNGSKYVTDNKIFYEKHNIFYKLLNKLCFNKKDIKPQTNIILRLDESTNYFNSKEKVITKLNKKISTRRPLEIIITPYITIKNNHLDLQWSVIQILLKDKIKKKNMINNSYNKCDDESYDGDNDLTEFC
jgi:hypothetical protein